MSLKESALEITDTLVNIKDALEDALHEWGVQVIWDFEISVYPNGIGIKMNFVKGESFPLSYQNLKTIAQLTHADDILFESSEKPGWVKLIYKDEGVKK